MLEQVMVVSVRVYRPIKNYPRQPISSFRYSQEIVLLGNLGLLCQYISETNLVVDYIYWSLSLRVFYPRHCLAG